jgi:hypothetical protein
MTARTGLGPIEVAVLDAVVIQPGKFVPLLGRQVVDPGAVGLREV